MRAGLALWMIGTAAVAAVPAGPAHAARLVAGPAASDVQAVIDTAADGDTVILEGEHRGNVRILRPITLEGQPGAALTGDGTGSVIVVASSGSAVRGLTIRGSGHNLERMDAGVFVEQSATGAVIEGNRLEGNLYGIYLHGAENAIVRGNTIVGIAEGRVNESGNGISVWNAPGARVEDNDIRFGRDGIFVVTSRNNVFRGNRLSDLRFAVHYMYTNDSEISHNVSTGNTVGFALMFSHRLVVRDNVSDGDRDRGMLLNFANASDISGNIVRGRLLPAERWASPGTRRKADREHGLPDDGESGAAHADGPRPGPEKCVFMYNANKNLFRDNRFEGCEIGIHFTAGSEGNEISGNAFIDNRTQVKYVGTRLLDWSQGGRGNYWSDNPAFDLDGDGLADTAYRPNDVIDKVLWTAPQAKVLINSPAVEIIRWAQAQFPAILPGGVVDRHPLIAPPPVPGGRP